MTEVRKHQRKTASGKTTTVRHHTRQGGDGQGSDSDNRIPDPDDPANHESLHALAALGE